MGPSKEVIRAMPAAAKNNLFEVSEKIFKWTNEGGVKFECHISDPSFLDPTHGDMPAALAEAKSTNWSIGSKTVEKLHYAQQRERELRAQYQKYAEELEQMIRLQCQKIREAKIKVWIWKQRAFVLQSKKEAELRARREQEAREKSMSTFNGLND